MYVFCYISYFTQELHDIVNNWRSSACFQ